MKYYEPVLEAESVSGLLSTLAEADPPPLIVKLGERYYPLHQLLLTLDGKSARGVRVLSSSPGLRSALKLLSQGHYLVVRSRAVTPRSVIRYLLEEEFLANEAVLERVTRYAVPCLKSNATVKTVVRFLEARGAVAAPLCWQSRIKRVVTIVDALSYAVSSGLSRRSLLLDRSSAARIGGSRPRAHSEPLQPLLNGLYAVTPTGLLLDVSSLRMMLGELSVEV
ncbi:MAG: hypothetical protein QXI90_01740 [Thermofilum sp.]